MLALFALTAATPCKSGFYLGANIGLSSIKQKLKDNAIKQGGNERKGVDASSNGFLLQGFGGYGMILNQFYLGGEVYVGFDTGKSKILDEEGFKPGFNFGLKGRFGMYLTPSTLGYGVIGVDIARHKISRFLADVRPANPIFGPIRITSGNSVAEGNVKKTSARLLLGLGSQVNLSSNFGVRLEYNYIFGASKTFKGLSTLGADTEVKSKFDTHRVMLGVQYNF